ncbi:unnamed protein product, partial [Effrenium voratum]
SRTESKDAMTVVEKVFVVVSFVVSLVVNALASTGVLGGESIATISDTTPTYVTPDGLTFSVWAVIYSLELLLVVRQACPSDHTESLLQKACPITGLSVRWRLVIAFLTNAIWLPVYVNRFFGLALAIILVYLGFLLSVFSDLNTKTADSFCEWFSYSAGIACNCSWVVVATCANAFTWFGELGWKDAFGVAGTPTAGAVVAVAVTFIAIALAVFRSDLAWSLVAAWALGGLFRMHTVVDPESFPEGAMNHSLALVAIWCCGVVLLASVIGLFLVPTNAVFQDKGVMGARPLNS